MPATFSAVNAAVSISARDLILAACYEINAVAPGEPLTAEDAAWGLEKLQRLTDQFNARRELIFSVGFTQYNLQANHAPHTIGPGGDFNIPIRPVKIISAAFILNSGSSSAIDRRIEIRDDDWWAAVPQKSLTSSIVSELYYDPGSPLGSLNFWPISTVAAPIRLQSWTSLAQAVSLQGKLGFVQGYWDAIVTDLAVRLCPSFEKPVPADLKEQWNRAMRVIQANNDGPPRIQTDGGGIAGSGHGGRPDFNFLTGMRE